MEQELYVDRKYEFERQQSERLYTYWKLLMKEYAGSQDKNTLGNRINNVLEKESMIEKNIYSSLQKWEKRHPILGIIICTILGAVFLELLIQIIMNAIL
ncbi:MAG TPA: hypothetical protein IAA06_11295 [Candidatus Blautia faecavium]|uniref:Uncharacterized protein n=1 Tax=Candidatus Blautia faecavium TaxID=2838487 RepID=A0A9D2LUC0_9FIRM|nr:hypothetical protein [Candidatus Blautia faecavium]